MEDSENERLRELLKKLLAKPPKTYKKGWNATRAEEQRQRCLKHKPWEHSTGAITPQGKKICGQNARKHGLGHLLAIHTDIAEAYYGKSKPKKKKKDV